MQLSCIKISNILSFPFIDDLDTFSGICFDDDKNHDVNVFIGPNGSGKSNLLEIVNQVIKVGLYHDFVLNTERIKEYDPQLLDLDGKTISVITQREQHYKYLNKHFASKHKDGSVMLKLSLYDADISNLEHVLGYRLFFEQLISYFSSIDFAYPDFSSTIDLKLMTSLDLYFVMDEESHVLAISYDKLLLSGEEKHIYDIRVFYLQYFELFQLCLVLWNHYLQDADHLTTELCEIKKIAPVSFALHGNFATLGSSREFTEDQMDTSVSHFLGEELDDLVYSQDTKKHGQAPIGYFLCKKRLLEHHKSQSTDLTLAILDGMSIEDQLRLAKEKADYHSNFYEMLRYYVKTYTGYDMVSFVKDEKIVLFFVDAWDNFYRLNELSSGEQSFLYIIFTLFGYGLENGILILDEPETHLHPQKQDDMLRMLQEIAHQYSIQILIATHSPLMITEDTISHVYRLHWKDIGTHVHNSLQHFTPYESNLIQMLQFGYIAKVFFVQKIIMVEGDTDEYFIDYYLNYLHREDNRAEIKDFAVINVNGKGGYKTWKKFLAKFGIESYFIGDRDNIIDTGFQISFAPLWEKQKADFYDRLGKTLPNGSKRYWRKSYGYLVDFIKNNDPKTYDAINLHIDKVYNKDVFVLHRGDLERYLGLSMKGLDETVKFCHTGFDGWLADEKFNEERQELEDIFGIIFD